MQERKVVVTGSEGFIGKRLLGTLARMGLVVQGWDPGGESARKTFDDFVASLNGFQPKVIFHVGADSNTLAQSVNEVMRANYLFTKRLSDWASARGVDVIFSSSAACYGNKSGHPENLYAWSKFAAEDYVRLSGGVCLRYFNVYGPGEAHKREMASFVMQAWKASILGTQPRLFPGQPRRDFVFVDDVVSANIAAMDNLKFTRSEVYDVGTGRARTFEDCLDLMGLTWSYADSRAIPEGYQFFTQADPDKFVPNWRPSFSLEDGMREYRKFLENN